MLSCETLLEKGYNYIFRSPFGNDYIKTIWNIDNAPARLEALIADRQVDNRCRFLVAEILFNQHSDFIIRMDYESMAQVYFEAAMGDFSTQMSDWAFYGGKTSLELLGKRILIFGQWSTKLWKEILWDNRPLPFNFMDEPDADASYRFSDLAALLIKGINGDLTKFPHLLDERNYMIEQMKKNYT